MRGKKNAWKDFVLGMVIMALLAALAVPALATTGKMEMGVEYPGIHVHVDGIPFTPTDANGNKVEPFVSEGTTYLPVRAIGEALGKDVRWDGPTRTVYITDPDPATLDTATTNNKTSNKKATGKKTIEVDYLDIKLVVNGKEVTPKDANGKVVEPFAYNGTTYLPVRAVGEALGKTVRWDGETNTVHLGELPQGTYLVDVCKVNKHKKDDIYRAADHKAFTFDGKRYSQGFWGQNTYNTSLAAFELGGKYESLTFDFINYEADRYDRPSLYVYLDGKWAQTVEWIKGGGVQTVTVPLNYAQTITFDGEGWIANAVLHGERAVPEKPVPPENATYLVDVCTVDGGYIYKAAEGKYETDIFGNKYTNGIGAYGVVQLNGKYKTLKATIVSYYSYAELREKTYTFSVDGKTVKEIVLSDTMAPQAIEIPLNYGLELEISGNGRGFVILADAILE